MLNEERKGSYHRDERKHEEHEDEDDFPRCEPEFTLTVCAHGEEVDDTIMD